MQIRGDDLGTAIASVSEMMLTGGRRDCLITLLGSYRVSRTQKQIRGTAFKIDAVQKAANAKPKRPSLRLVGGTEFGPTA